MSGKHEKRGQRRWLLLVHQLPPNPSNVRVRTWRRLRQLGAVAVKQAAYVLPDSPSAREDFEWLKAEIEASSGEASVFAADSVDGRSDAEIVSEFRRTREESYKALARDVEAAHRRLSKSRPGGRGRNRPWQRRLEDFARRLMEIEAVDFFGAPGRDRVSSLIDRLKREVEGGNQTPRRAAASAGKPALAPGQLWVTRPRPGIDRIASAWLIRRFIDPEARFGFVADAGGVPANAVPFDMFGVELSHRGDGCTFETLTTTFGVDDPAASRLAGIVHDLDLKDGRFGAPEAGAIGILVEGLAKLYPDDETLLTQGIVLFEALYRGLQESPRRRAKRPRPERSPQRSRSAKRGEPSARAEGARSASEERARTDGKSESRSESERAKSERALEKATSRGGGAPRHKSKSEGSEPSEERGEH